MITYPGAIIETPQAELKRTEHQEYPPLIVHGPINIFYRKVSMVTIPVVVGIRLQHQEWVGDDERDLCDIWRANPKYLLCGKLDQYLPRHPLPAGSCFRQSLLVQKTVESQMEQVPNPLAHGLQNRWENRSRHLRHVVQLPRRLQEGELCRLWDHQRLRGVNAVLVLSAVDMPAWGQKGTTSRFPPVLFQGSQNLKDI